MLCDDGLSMDPQSVTFAALLAGPSGVISIPRVIDDVRPLLHCLARTTAFSFSKMVSCTGIYTVGVRVRTLLCTHSLSFINVLSDVLE